MRVTLTSAMPRHRWSVASIRRWPLWALAPGARAYVMATVLPAAAFAVLAAWHTTWHPSQVPVYLLLLACSAAMIEAIRDVKLSRDTMTRDLQEVWYLSIALLLPPIYVLLAPIPLVVMKQLRVRRNLLHRRGVMLALHRVGSGAAAAGVA